MYLKVLEGQQMRERGEFFPGLLKPCSGTHSLLWMEIISQFVLLFVAIVYAQLTEDIRIFVPIGIVRIYVEIEMFLFWKIHNETI